MTCDQGQEGSFKHCTTTIDKGTLSVFGTTPHYTSMTLSITGIGQRRKEEELGQYMTLTILGTGRRHTWRRVELKECHCTFAIIPVLVDVCWSFLLSGLSWAD